MSPEHVKFDLEKYCYVNEKGEKLKTEFEYLKGKKAITVVAKHGEHVENVDIILLPSLAWKQVCGDLNEVDKIRLKIIEECGLRDEFKDQLMFMEHLYRTRVKK